MVPADSVFPDERQRLQHSTGVLMGAFFGCRLCSLFDTRVKLDLLKIDDLSSDDGKVVRDNGANNKLKDNNSIVFDSDCQSNKPRKIHNNNDDSSSEKDGDSDTAYDDDSDSNSNSLYDLGDNSDTDDECTANPKKRGRSSIGISLSILFPTLIPKNQIQFPRKSH